MKASSKQINERKTLELTQRDNRDSTKVESPPSSQVVVDIAGQSHIGNLRCDNQDYFLAVRLERSLNTHMTNLPPGVLPQKVNEIAYGIAVADGMGGMPAGWLASSLALRKLIDLVVKTPDWIMRMNRRKAAVVKRRMTQRFRQIDLALRARGEGDPRLAGMGSTLTAACSLGADLFVGHIGDSRAYLLRGGDLRQLTHDHTLAQAMIDAGAARADDAVVHPMRRVLMAALGSTGQPSDPEVQRLYLRNEDQLLLCTDGLTEYVDSEGITSILRNASSADEACRALIEAALTGGGNDNVTVVLARYRFPQPAP